MFLFSHAAPMRQTLALLVAIAAFAVAPVAAQAVEFRTGEQVEVTGPFEDMLFVSADQLRLAPQSDDDIFAAAETIAFDGGRTLNLFLAAGQIRFQTGEARDALMLGRDIDFEDGVVADDVYAAGRNVRVGSGFEIGGTAFLAGQTVTVAGPVAGELRTAGETVRIEGSVGGDVVVYAQRLEIGPGARIGGDLTYEADEVVISPDAVITGRTVVQEPREPKTETAPSPWEAALGGLLWSLAVGVVGGGLLTFALAMLFPGFMAAAAGRISERPLPTLGLGFLLALIAAPLIALLFVSVVGIPLGLLVIGLYLVAWPAGLAAFAYGLAMMLRRLAARGGASDAPGLWAKLGWSLAATALICLVGAIPIIGGFAWLLAWILGLGALAAAARGALARG